MGKYHIFQENTEFTPKILKIGEIYTDSEMYWLEALFYHSMYNYSEENGALQSRGETTTKKVGGGGTLCHVTRPSSPFPL